MSPRDEPRHTYPAWPQGVLWCSWALAGHKACRGAPGPWLATVVLLSPGCLKGGIPDSGLTLLAHYLAGKPWTQDPDWPLAGSPTASALTQDP